ncbi:dihydrofolate reductase [Streptomyces pactum]|uniref:Dihydrofolate reductase n=1 Tax=Streptomyces pactum TaxID=68249 RepID=A0ABS0NK68_9ACTN|nr:dihydrofolate reductase family protein [Streptomyces pactum]MBH5335590.1 dihydrofolate reductase [Streptomyces pactum]
MRIMASAFISLDGVVQAPGGPQEDTDGGFAHGGWSQSFFDPEVVGGAFDDALRTADALLFGRRTWQTMAAAWPERAGDPFADRMNAITKYVVSTTLGEADLTWNNTTLIPGGEAVARLRELRAGGDGTALVMGSPTLVRTLLSEGLLDELRLIIMPVLLGGGKTIFPADGGLRTLKLVSTVTSDAGVQVCTYRTVAGTGTGADAETGTGAGADEG